MLLLLLVLDLVPHQLVLLLWFWAEVHYSARDAFDYERMVAFSEANQLRLRRAFEILRRRREEAEAAANWEETRHYSMAMAEVRSLQDLA